MTDTTKTLISDLRRRNLTVLGAAAAVTVVLAWVAVSWRASEVAPQYKPALLFPELASEADEVSHIRIVSKRGTVDVVFKPDKGWVVSSYNDYPAALDARRQTIIGMANLETIEPKTARQDWLHYLNLDAPPQGSGIAISLLNEKGETLAAMIAGKTEDLGDPTGENGLFVRKVDSDQSWLARTVFEPKNDPTDWLDKQVLDVDRTQIQETDVDPVNGPSYEVRRDKPSDEDFNPVNIPKGREMAYQGAADGVAAAIVGFTFDDVRPAKDFNFSDPAHTARIVTHTFDGLAVTAQTIQQGQDYWTTLSAEGLPGKTEGLKQAREIAARTSGWAYKLPSYKGQIFMTSLDSLLKPLAKAVPGPTAK